MASSSSAPLLGSCAACRQFKSARREVMRLSALLLYSFRRCIHLAAEVQRPLEYNRNADILVTFLRADLNRAAARSGAALDEAVARGETSIE